MHAWGFWHYHVFLESCSGTKQIEGTLKNNDLVVPVTSFQHNNSFRKYIVVIA